MADWPNERVHKNVISTWSQESTGVQQRALGGTTASGSSTWSPAFSATFVPFIISTNYTVQKVWWYNGSAVAGNVDVGVYTADATPTRLFSIGSTAATPINTVQSVAITPYTLTPGSYYLAMNASSATMAVWRMGLATVLRAMTGIGEQAVGAVTLPATATLVTTATAFAPLFGITNGTVL